MCRVILPRAVCYVKLCEPPTRIVYDPAANKVCKHTIRSWVKGLLTLTQRDYIVGLLGRGTDAQLVDRQEAKAVDGEGRQPGHLIWGRIRLGVDPGQLLPNTILALPEKENMFQIRCFIGK